jgi:GNAT superfamily N-acetyltransferase
MALAERSDATVQAVEGGAALEAFLRLPYRLHAKHPNWVPPLLRDERRRFSPENPFFRHAEARLFLARRSGVAVGRIAAILDRNQVEASGEPVGFFGAFECAGGQEVAAALLDAAGAWLRARGMRTMRGPVDLSTNETCAFLVEGFESPPMLMMPWNPPEYPALVAACGLVKAKDLFAYVTEVPEQLPERVTRVAAAARERGVRVRPIVLRALPAELERIRGIYNEAWRANWGFVPITGDEMAHTAAQLKALVLPDLALLAEVGGEPVGFFLALPDYNQVLRRLGGRLGPVGLARALWYSRRITDMRVMIFGVRPAWQRKGVDALLVETAFAGARRRGFRRCEFSWILEDNVIMRRTAESWSARVYKRYRIYERPL